MKDSSSDIPHGYHITFNCYGARLHGDEKGSIDRKHFNTVGSPTIPANQFWLKFERDSMDQPPYILDQPRRKIVLNTIMEVCAYRGWYLWALHIRSNHVHAVVSGLSKPEKILNDFKSYSSRRLNEAGYDYKGRKRWERHGSTQYKWSADTLADAIEYVIYEQGEPMECHIHDGDPPHW